MKSSHHNLHRMLHAENLERRDLLAAGFGHHGDLAPPDAPDSCDVAIVQQSCDGTCDSDALLQQRGRAGEDNDTGQGAQEHPRDRDSQDALLAVSSAQPAVADQAGDAPQQRNQASEDNDTGLGAQQRPRDRDSQDSTLAAGTMQLTAATAEDEPLQQRKRDQEDSETGSGAQQRPRDRNSQDAAANMESRLAASATQQNERKEGGVGQQQGDLNEAEIDSITFMREEEKLARDVYLTLGQTWDAAIFDNIAQSEQAHMDALKTLIDKYGLDDPVVDDAVGEFTNPDFAVLYTDLVAAGSTSLVEALKVGAMIEELDITDLEGALQDVTNSDVQRVYENLLRGSRNHLRAFAARLEALGETYEAQFLSQEQFDAIVAEVEEGGQRKLVGVGRLVSDAGHRTAEYAVLVGDAWQGRGLGRLLTDYCLEVAQRWGLRRVIAQVSKDNLRMLKILRDRQFETTGRNEDVVFVSKEVKE